MEQVHLKFSEGFHVVAGNQRAQAAVMVLAPGATTGGPDNEHPDSDQWLYVVSGEGTAIVAEQHHQLTAGTLVLIEHGEDHEICNTGEVPLETLNLYVPPAYA